MTRKKPTGYVIYDGPSLADGAPIIVIATIKSGNSKTGDMLQTWIIRKDIDRALPAKPGQIFRFADIVHTGALRHLMMPRPRLPKNARVTLG